MTTAEKHKALRVALNISYKKYIELKRNLNEPINIFHKKSIKWKIFSSASLVEVINNQIDIIEQRKPNFSIIGCN